MIDKKVMLYNSPLWKFNPDTEISFQELISYMESSHYLPDLGTSYGVMVCELDLQIHGKFDSY